MGKKCVRVAVAVLALAGAMLGGAQSVRAQATYAGYAKNIAPGAFAQPSSVAVDANGNLFVTNNGISPRSPIGVYEVPSGCVTQSCVVSLGSGWSNPQSVAIDSLSGNIYVADLGLQAVEMLTKASGYSSMTAVGGTFSDPAGVAVDKSGNIYVADANTYYIFEFAPTCTSSSCVTSLGGDHYQYSNVAVDASGNIYATDYRNSVVRKMTLGCTTISCYPAIVYTGVSSAQINGVLTNGQLHGLSIDSSNNLYVADYYLGTVVKVPAGCTTTSCAVSQGTWYNHPLQPAVDSSGNVFIPDSYSGQVREVENSGAPNIGNVSVGSTVSDAYSVFFSFSATTNLYSTTPVQFVMSGNANQEFNGGTNADPSMTPGACGYASINNQDNGYGPVPVTYNTGASCYVNIDFSPLSPGGRQGAVELLDASGNVLASALVGGVGVAPLALVDSFSTAWTVSGLSSARGLSLDGKGNLYFIDTGNQQLDSVSSAGVKAVIDSGLATSNSTGSATAVDGAGNLYLRVSSGQIYEYVGAKAPALSLGSIACGSDDNLAVDAAGNLYFSCYGASTGAIYKMAAGTNVLTQLLPSGFGHRFIGMALDAAGDIFAADLNNNTLYELPAGTSGSASLLALSTTGLSVPTAVAVDPAGDVYVTNQNGATVSRYAAGTWAYSSLPLAANAGIAFDTAGSIYLENESGSMTVTKYGRTATPAFTFAASTPLGTTSYSTQTYTFENDGNAALSVSGYSGTGAFSLAGPSNTCALGSLASAATCVVQGAYTPTAIGSLSGTGTITSNSDNASSATQTFSMSSSGSKGTPTVNVASPSVDQDAPVTLTATVSYGSLPKPTGAMTFKVDSTTLSPTSTCTAYGNVCTYSYSYNTANAGTTVGAHTITASLASDTNYNTSSGTGTLTVLATTFATPLYTVTTATDDSASPSASNCTNQALSGATLDANCSLRDAMLAVNALGYVGTSSLVPVINFSTTLNGQTITLGLSMASLTGNVNIVGPGPGTNAITLSGNSAYQFLTQSASSAVTMISGLTMTKFKGTTGPVFTGTTNGLSTFTNDIFTSNTASGNTGGGAIYVTTGTISVTNSYFSGNTVVIGAGGAIDISGASALILTNDTFSANSSTIHGGAVAIAATGTYTITNTVFSGNTITGGQPSTIFAGGGLYAPATASSNLISNCSFTGNTISGSASLGNAEGGGAYVGSGSVVNSLFASNTATESVGSVAEGGGLYLGSNKVTLTGVTVSGNTVSSPTSSGSTAYGGGIYAINASDALYNVTVTGNSVKGNTSGGGGMYSASAMTAYNSVISGNTVGTTGGSHLDLDGTITGSGNYIDSSTTTTCTSSCSAQLAALPASSTAPGNGMTIGAPGYTSTLQVMLPLPGSPLLGAGVVANINSDAYDGRGTGYARTVTYNGSTSVDIGAAEAGYTNYTSASSNSFTAPTEPVGTASATQTAYVYFTTSGTVGNISVVTQGNPNLDFQYVSGGTCAVGTAYTAGQNCTVQYTFTPAAPGPRLGAIVLTSSTPTVLATTYLVGTGTGPLATFTPGTISTVAGNGTAGYSGDSGAATSAELSNAYGVAVDAVGNMYIADYSNNRVRKVTAATGDISTVAGSGTVCSPSTAACGDGGSATATGTDLGNPYAVAVDGAGNLYIADTNDNRIRKVTAATGIISTVAGTGTQCSPSTATCGDSGAATSANLNGPSAVAVDGAGNLYIADANNNRIRMVSATTGTISTVAGNGTACNSPTSACGDSGTATSANLTNPNGIALDGAGNLYIADVFENRIRKVTAATGIISTVAGTGTQCSPSTATCGDGGSATASGSDLAYPNAVAVDSAGNLYIADAFDHRIRKVTPAGTISTVGGTGIKCSPSTSACGDGGAATSAGVNMAYPYGVAVDGSGNLYIADDQDNRIRKISASAAPLSFATTSVGATSSDSPQTVTLNNIGNAALTFPLPTMGTDPSISTGFTIGNSSTCPQLTTSSSSTGTLASGASCTDLISFAPTQSGSYSGQLVTTDNSLNVSPSTQTVGLSGSAGYLAPTVTAITPADGPTIGGNIVTITGTNFTGATAVNFGSVAGTNVMVISSTSITVVAPSQPSGSVYVTVTTPGGTSPNSVFYMYDAPVIYQISPSYGPAAGGGTITMIGNNLNGATAVNFGAVPATILTNTATSITATIPVGTAATTVGVTVTTGTYGGGTISNSVQYTYSAPSAYTAPTEPVGTASATQTAYVNITTAGTLNAINVLTQGATGLDFNPVTGGTCAVGTTYNVGQVCSVLYSFTPEYPGQRLGAVSLVNSSGTIMATAYISGTGTGPLVDFSTSVGADVVTSGLTDSQDVVTDAAGNLYITSGTYLAKAAAGSTTATNYVNLSTYGEITGVAIDGAGTLYVTDNQYAHVFKIVGTTVTPLVTTTLSHPQGIVADGAGNVFFTDQGSNMIYEVPAGATSATVIIPSSGGLNAPTGLALDNAGGLYVANQNGNTISHVAQGATVATSVATPGFTLNRPEGLAVDAAGNLYIDDLGNSRFIEVPATGAAPFVLGTQSSSYFMSIDGAGRLYVADSVNHKVFRFDRTTATPLLFPNTAVGGTSRAQNLQLENDGNASLSVASVLPSNTNFGFAGGVASGSTPGCGAPVAPGAQCNVQATFTPKAVGGLSGSGNVTDNSLNVTGSTQTVALSGTATQAAQTIAFTLASPVTYGASPITLVATGGASGNPVTFSIISGAAYGSLSGANNSVLTISGAGTIVIAANQAGSTNYSAAPQVMQTLVVNQSTNSIAFSTLTSPVTVNATATLAATASSGAAVTYTVTSGSATISGTTLTYTNAGSVTIAANSAATANYLAAPTVSQTVTVSPAASAYTAPTEPVGTASATQTAYVNITTAGTLGTISLLTQGATGLDYNATGGTCAVGTAYTVGQACSVTYTFTPTHPGQRAGGITLTGAGTPMGSVYLSGTGTGPQAIFPAAATRTNLGSTSYDMLGIAVDGNGNVFYVDPDHSAVREITAASGYASVIAIGSGFSSPYGIAVDGNGNVFVGDAGKLQVYELLASSGYATVVPVGSGYGRPGQSGVAVDASGNLFVSDYAFHTVTERTAASGYSTVKTILSGLNFPTGVAVDANGNVFVADQNAKTVTEVFASSGYTTTQPVGSGYAGPNGVTVDASGNVFVADEGGGIKEVFAAGGYTTVTNPGGAVFAYSIAQNGNGNLFLGDGGGSIAQLFNMTTPPSLAFGTLNDGSSNTQSFTIGNDGNAPLTAVAPGISGLTTGVYAQVAGSGTPADCTASLSVASGATCNVSIKFAPVTPNSGAYPDTYLLSDNNLNGSPSATQTITLSGNAVQLTKTINFLQPTTPVNVTSSATLSAMASNGDPVTYSVTSGTASIVGSTITYTTVGSVTIAANSAATSSTTAAPQVSRTVVVTQIPQAITFTASSPVTYGVSPITLVATGGASGNPVTFSILSGGAYGTLSGTNNSVLTVTGAGSIVIAANQVGSTNYAAATQVTQTVIVNKATLTAAIIGTPTKTYNGTTAATLTSTNYQLAGLVGSDSFTVTQTAGTYAAATAGTQTVTASLSPSDFTTVSGSLSNYTLPTSASGSGTISQATLTVTAGSYSGVYDGASHNLSACTVSANPDGITCSNPGTVGPDVGAGSIVPLINAPTSNYTVTLVTGSWSITAKPVTVTAGSYSGTYDGSTHSPSACTSSYAGVTCSNSPASVGPGLGSATLTPVVSYLAGIASDYKISPQNGSWSITQASSMTAVSCPASVVYNGTAQVPCTATVTGIGGLNQSVSVYYAANTNVGSASASATFAGDTNHTGSTSSTTFTILPAPQAITFTPVPTSPDTAGNSVVLSATGGASGNPVVFSVLSGNASLADDGVTLTYTGAGTVVVAVDQAGGGNYVQATEVTATVVVNPAAAAYAAGTVQVTQQSSVLTATLNFPNGGTLGSLSYLTQGVPNLDFIGCTPGAQVKKPSNPKGGTSQPTTFSCPSSKSKGGAVIPVCSVGTAYSAGQICTVSYIFQPTAPGQRLGGVTALDGSGNLMGSSYITGTGTGPVAVLTPGTISTVAGTYYGNPLGDGGAATSAGLFEPTAVTVDAAGNFYIVDTGSQRIRKVTASTGIITTVAGNGGQGFSGDGGPATSASLGNPSQVAVDGLGNLFIADSVNNRIREVTAATGMITTVAGSGGTGYAGGVCYYCGSSIGDGGPATSGYLWNPDGVAVDGAGNLYISDFYNQSLRMVTAATGIITTVAGNGNYGTATAPGGYGIPITSPLLRPTGLAIDGSGNVYVADIGKQSVWKVTPSTGAFSVVAGNNSSGNYTGDGGPATSAALDNPYGVAVDASGNIYIGDSGNQAVRKVTASTGIITTIAGTGNSGLSGDGGPANTALLYYPDGVAVDGAGNLYIADRANERIREVSASSATHNFADTNVGSTSSDSPATVLVANDGYDPTNTNPLTLSSVSNGTTNFVLDSSNACTTSTSLEPGQTCALAVDFTPQVSGTPLTDAVTLTDNNLNNISSTSSQQTVALSGNGLQQTPGVTVVPATITYGTPTVALSATVSFAGSTAPTGAFTFSIDGGATVAASCTGTTSPFTCMATYPNSALQVVATHTITASIAATPGFLIASGTNTLTVTPAGLDVSIIGNPTKVYDSTSTATLTTANYQVNGLVGTDAITISQMVGAYQSANVGTNIPMLAQLFSNQFTATSGSLTNYILPGYTSSGTGTITKAPLTITAGSYTGVYDGSTHALSACVVSSNPDGLTCTNSPVGPVGPDTGGAIVTALISGLTANYSVTTNNGSWSITPLSVTVTAGSYSGTYDGSAHSPSACTSSYAGVTCANSSASVGPGAGSGVVTPVASVVSGIAADYTITSQNGAWSIAQAGSVTSITCPTSVVYNGTAQTPCSATVTGAGGLSQSVSVTYGANTIVGQASASATFAGDANHTGSTKSTTFAINPALLTVTAGSYTGVYDGAAHALSACTVSTNFDGLTCTNSPATVGPDFGFGTVTPVISGTTSNYTVTSNTGAWSITAKPVTITAGSYSGVYDGAAHAPFACTSSYVGVTCSNSPVSVGPGVGSGAVNPVASFATGIAGDYTVTTVAGSYSITKLAASVTPNAATKVFGTSDPVLSGSLSGFLPADGVTATYSRVSGESVAGSPYTISATLSPTAVLANYAITYNIAAFTITKAAPVLTWSAPSAITYGTALSSTQLNATSNLTGGTFSYTPSAGTVLGAGTQTLTLLYTPSDTTDYTTASAQVMLTVNQATPVVTWSNPPSIVYGTATGVAQQTATAKVPGSFFYTQPSGVVLKVGTYPLGVAFTPTDTVDYAPVSAYATLTVTPATPVVTWANPPSIVYGTATGAAQKTATATGVGGASLPGSYFYTTPDGTVFSVGTHPLGVAFTPTDSTDYVPVSAYATITVTKATPTVTWAAPAAITYGTALSSAQLNATASVPGTFSYTPAVGTVLHAGTQTLSVTFTPTDSTDYNSVTTTVPITVNKATPTITWPKPAAINYGTVLGSAQLNATASVPGTFIYAPAAGTLLTGGTQPLSVSFTPTDTTDYNGASATNTITVNESTVSLGVSSGTQTYETWTNFVLGPSWSGNYSTSKVPTGTVTLYDNGVAWVTLPLGPNGLAYYTSNPPLSAGVHNLTVSYSGDANYPPGLSAVVTITVLPAPVNFQASCFGAQVYTQAYQCTVNLSASTTSPPVGSIQYSLDGAAPTTVAINSAGNAPFTVSTIPSAGSHTLVITYGGQGNYAAAKPITYNFTTQPGQTELQVSPSAYFVAHGSSVTLSGSATSIASGIPSGTVTFYDNGAAIGTATIAANGAVSYTVSSIAKGSHTFSASYAGSANYASATSSSSFVTAF